MGANSLHGLKLYAVPTAFEEGITTMNALRCLDPAGQSIYSFDQRTTSGMPSHKEGYFQFDIPTSTRAVMSDYSARYLGLQDQTVLPF
jgi:hypothetical protein